MEIRYCVNCETEAVRYFDEGCEGDFVYLCAQCWDAFSIGQRNPEVDTFHFENPAKSVVAPITATIEYIAEEWVKGIENVSNDR